MPNKLDREPVAAAAGLNVVIQALMQVLVAFNVPLSPVQTGAITTFVVVFSAWWVRGKVFAPVDATGAPIMAVPKEIVAAKGGGAGTDPKNCYHPYTGEPMSQADFDALVARMLKPDDHV